MSNLRQLGEKFLFFCDYSYDMGYSINLNQKGNSVLFVLVCIPIALSFLVLVIDISRHQSSRDGAQKFADNLIFQAGKFLPNQEAVDNYINLQIQQQQDFGLVPNSLQILSLIHI